MKSINQLTKTDLDPIKLLCFDCDGVTIEKGTFIREKQGELIVRTSKLNDQLAQKLNRLKKQFLVMLSSGRHPLYLARMYEKILWDRVIIQGENGILTLFNGEISQTKQYPMKLLTIATKIKSDIRQLAKTNQQIQGFEPKQFLLSVHCHREVPEIRKIIQKYDSKNQFYCLWNGEAYDIGPKQFNKGQGLKNLVKKFNLNMDNVLAVGNDPNDKQMVEWAGIGVTTDPDSVIKGADFVTEQRLHLGGEEVTDRILKVISD